MNGQDVTVVNGVLAKLCPKCKAVKPLLDGFAVSRNTRSGYASDCRECARQAVRRHRLRTDYANDRAYASAKRRAYQELARRHEREFSLLLKTELHAARSREPQQAERSA